MEVNGCAWARTYLLIGASGPKRLEEEARIDDILEGVAESRSNTGVIDQICQRQRAFAPFLVTTVRFLTAILQ